MDVHPTKNGINRYWSIPIYIYMAIKSKIPSVQRVLRCGFNTHRIHGAAIYGVPWIPSIYPLYVSIYTSTMDPMGHASSTEAPPPMFSVSGLVWDELHPRLADCHAGCQDRPSGGRVGNGGTWNERLNLEEWWLNHGESCENGLGMAGSKLFLWKSVLVISNHNWTLRCKTRNTLWFKSLKLGLNQEFDLVMSTRGLAIKSGD